MSDERKIYHHKKRGTSYRVLGPARVQCEGTLKDCDTVLVYQNIHNGTYSVRPPTEFYDGRFEELKGDWHPWSGIAGGRDRTLFMKDKMVEVLLRNGTRSTDLEINFTWWWENSPGDIVAYRVIEEH